MESCIENVKNSEIDLIAVPPPPPPPPPPPVPSNHGRHGDRNKKVPTKVQQDEGESLFTPEELEQLEIRPSVRDMRKLWTMGTMTTTAAKSAKNAPRSDPASSEDLHKKLMREFKRKRTNIHQPRTFNPPKPTSKISAITNALYKMDLNEKPVLSFQNEKEIKDERFEKEIRNKEATREREEERYKKKKEGILSCSSSEGYHSNEDTVDHLDTDEPEEILAFKQILEKFNPNFSHENFQIKKEAPLKENKIVGITHEDYLSENRKGYSKLHKHKMTNTKPAEAKALMITKSTALKKMTPSSYAEVPSVYNVNVCQKGSENDIEVKSLNVHKRKANSATKLMARAYEAKLSSNNCLN